MNEWCIVISQILDLICHIEASIFLLIPTFTLVDFSVFSLSPHPSEIKNNVLLGTRASFCKNDFSAAVVPSLHIGIKKASTDSKGGNAFWLTEMVWNVIKHIIIL